MSFESNSHGLIPNLEELGQILGVTPIQSNIALFQRSLHRPLEDFLSAEGKKFRAEFIHFAFEYAGGVISPESQARLQLCAQIIEGLHAGSMIVDDIEDQSDIRRGKPTLYRKYGLGVALNAGNWLYFQAMDQVKKLDLSAHQEVILQRYMNQILIRAHYGQALDVGADLLSLPQAQVWDASLSAIELKTGALMSLAFFLGAFMAQPDQIPSDEGVTFAKQLGVALQMYDDLGNVLAPPPKGKEDLRNARPSFVWAVAARTSQPEDYVRFLHAVKMLPNESFLHSWIELHGLISQVRERASEYLWGTMSRFDLDSDLRSKLEKFCIKLESSYV